MKSFNDCRLYTFVDTAYLHGRAPELATLGRWVGADGCRLVAIVGMGGVGKTSLAARLARELARDFDAVYWRSVRNAPPPAEWLGGAILFLSAQQVLPAEGEEARLRQLLELLRARGPANIYNCALMAKPSYRTSFEGGPALEFVGFDAPDAFVVGYGLDAAQLYRNLPYIGALDPADRRG